ncbi:uncharacterized protein LOC134284037 [Aedes albopictus]|uniref:Reverse transcriptase domain-containing protein n=1 Tax=Aedes albopictus TaxID=7160 RepID=A0ABM1XTU6_AEDAL
MSSYSRIKPFDVTSEASNLPAEWEIWKSDLESFFLAQAVETQHDKRAQLAYLGGPGLQELLRHLPGVNQVPHVTADPPYYDVAIKCLDDYFEPFRRKSYERHLFHQITQQPEERFTDFVMRLRKQIARCNYNSCVVDELIADRITQGCKSQELRTRLLQKDRSLEEIIALGSRPKAKRIRAVQEETEAKQSKDFVFYAMGRNVFTFIVGGVEIPMTIDSGPDANIITKEIWEQMKQAGAVNNTVQAKFYVVEDGQRCLLGDKTAKDLQVLKVGFDIASVDSNRCKPFPKIRGVKVEIPIDEQVPPVQQPYRRPPIALEEKIETKLRSLLELDIIERAPGPSPWVSPMVPVQKDSGEIRLCIDMRRANQAVLRESHPLPLVDELLSSVSGAVLFSKLDIKDAYHQVELSERSRPITTFITKYGLYRYKRLMFGVSCAPELFQKTMEVVTAGLEGVIVYLDDAVVFGATKEEHDRRLAALLKRFSDYDILLNEQKCIYGVESLEFLGHQLSTTGVRPTESRLAAIEKFREP